MTSPGSGWLRRHGERLSGERDRSPHLGRWFWAGAGTLMVMALVGFVLWVFLVAVVQEICR